MVADLFYSLETVSYFQTEFSCLCHLNLAPPASIREKVQGDLHWSSFTRQQLLSLI